VKKVDRYKQAFGKPNIDEKLDMALLIKNFRSINNLDKNDMISGANICIEI
jgi:hypothetical protein